MSVAEFEKTCYKTSIKWESLYLPHKVVVRFHWGAAINKNKTEHVVNNKYLRKISQSIEWEKRAKDLTWVTAYL